MTLGKLLGALCLAALFSGAALGGLAGVAASLISEFQAFSDPDFASWGSGASWLGTTVAFAATGTLIGFGAGLVSFLGAATGLLVREKAQPGRAKLPIGAAAGSGAGISTATAAFLLLPNRGLDLAVLLIGVGLVLLSSTLAALLSTYANSYLNRRSPRPPTAGF